MSEGGETDLLSANTLRERTEVNDRLFWLLLEANRLAIVGGLALAVAGIMVTTVDAGTFPGSTFGIANITFLVGAAFTVTLVPFLLFASYISRVATVAKRTLAIEPLILRDSQR